MSIITFHSEMYFGGFAISQKRFDIREVSDANGDIRDRLIAPPRWRLRLTTPSTGVSYEQASHWKNLVLKLRGGINHLAAYDVAQPRPRGTLAGSPVVAGAGVTKGGTTVVVNGATPNTTLKIGDWLQIGTGLGSQYVSVAADMAFDGTGAGTVTFEPPSRLSYAAATPIVYDKPVAHYKMMTDAPEWAYTPGAFLVTGFSLDLMESWT